MGEQHTRTMYVDRLDRLFRRLDLDAFKRSDAEAESTAAAFVASLSPHEAADIAGRARTRARRHDRAHRRSQAVTMSDAGCTVSTQQRLPVRARAGELRARSTTQTVAAAPCQEPCACQRAQFLSLHERKEVA